LPEIAAEQEWAMSRTAKSIATVGMIVFGGLSVSACATTDYVDEQIAAVNARINTVEASAQAANAAAQQANATAQAAAASAATANQRLDQLTPRVDALEAKRPRN